MKQILNTLYVMTQGAYIHLENETVNIKIEQESRLRVPLHHLGGIVTMGNVLISPFLIAKCAQEGRGVTLLDRNGRFQCRMVGQTSGNVLLRQAQYAVASNAEATLGVARAIVAGKVKNARTLLMRGARESDGEDEVALREAAAYLARLLRALQRSDSLEGVRGMEGDASRVYFEVFDRMVKPPLRSDFAFEKRSRRPPLNRINALLSFLYTLASSDCSWALEGVGLDPQMGYLHAVRPGRASLAQDLVEEFRSAVADKLALTLINRRQIGPGDFDIRPGGAVWLSESGRRTAVTEYQKRKQEEISHPLFKEKAPIGLLPHIQARLLARHLRGESEHYTPMVFS
jgi:CRISPR-associated protein Cas1